MACIVSLKLRSTTKKLAQGKTDLRLDILQQLEENKRRKRKHKAEYTKRMRQSKVYALKIDLSTRKKKYKPHWGASTCYLLAAYLGKKSKQDVFLQIRQFVE